MLRLVRLAEQWARIERDLPEAWADARLVLRLEDARRAERAAALLAPAQPGRRGEEVRLTISRGPAGGVSPGTLARLLRGVDDERIGGTLELVTTADAPADAPVETAPRHLPLAQSWREQVAGLPDDWSDLLCEVELRSSDYMDRAALLMSPLNPRRDADRLALRFRVARTFGYGASQAMVRRCLERLDGERVVGVFRVLRALSDTDPVQTQGPVWYVAGRVV
jgi:hypothetical protein